MEGEAEKPFFKDLSYQERYFSTFDLKLRGWTPTMIRKLLPDHDAEKANYMRIQGRNGSRPLEHPVKLYDQDRIKHLEDSEEFFHLYERAQKALTRGEKRRQTVLRQKQTWVDEVVLQFTPVLQPDKTPRQHEKLFKATVDQLMQVMERVHIPQDMQEEAREKLQQKFDQAQAELRAARPSPGQKNRKKPAGQASSTPGKAK